MAPRAPVVDAHLHLWDPTTGWYGWLAREPAALQRRFDFDEVRQELDALAVAGVVLVQAADRDEDTDAMLAEAAVNPRVLGVVGYLPLEQPGRAAERLAALCGQPAFVGVRTLVHDQPDRDWLRRPDVADGLALLEAARVPFDLVPLLPRHLEHVPYLSARFPDLTIVLDHLATPPVGSDRREPWYGLLRRAAENPRVVVKVSGLYRADGRTPTGADLRPWVEDALALFGPDRLLVGSDWPMSVAAGGYTAVTGALLETVRALGDDALTRAVLAGTAGRVYGLDLPASP